jgi:hypothetical protein
MGISGNLREDAINIFHNQPARDITSVYLPRLTYPILIDEKLLCMEQDTINLCYTLAREYLLNTVLPEMILKAQNDGNKADIFQLEFAQKRLVKKWKVSLFIYPIFQMTFQSVHIFLSKPAQCFGLNEL